MELDNKKIKYKLIIDDVSTEMSVSNIDRDSLFEELQDKYGDILYSLQDEAPVYDKIVGEGFDWNAFEEIYSYLKDIFKDKYVSIYNDKNELVESYPAGEFLSDFLADRYFIDENADIEIGSIWSCQLQKFIDNSTWQYGLESKGGVVLKNTDEWPCPTICDDGKIIWKHGNEILTPIMWFGIPGDEILEMWTIDESLDCILPAAIPIEQGMGSYGGQLELNGLELDYSSLYDESMLTWYFGCGGNEGADFSKVLDTFPLESIMNKEGEDDSVNSKVTMFLYNLQNKL